MKLIWWSAFLAMIIAALLAVPCEAQKGKGGGKGAGKGGGAPAGQNTSPPAGPGNAEPDRPFDHPKSGNSLPQEEREKLPLGRRDMPEKQPGVANHLRKAGDGKPAVDPLKQPTHALPAQDRNASRPFAHPKSGNSLPQEVRDKLPPGLRDKPDNHPGLANHLRKMGVLKDYPAVDPVPPEVRNQLPPGLRGQPYDHPGVANHLGKLGWSIGEDGTLAPPTNFTPSNVTPPTQGSTPFESFQPFGGIFRRR